MGEQESRSRWLGVVPEGRPIGAREVGVRVLDGEVVWELGPPGALSIMRHLAMHAIVAAMVLPLSVAGIAALTWADWPLGLRVLLGALGLCGVAFCGVLMIWPILFGGLYRERLTLAQGRLVLARGIAPLFVREVELGAAPGGRPEPVAVPTDLGSLLRVPVVRSLEGGHGVALGEARARGRRARFGSWMDRPTAQRLSRQIAEVVGAGDEATRRLGVGAGAAESPRVGMGPRVGMAGLALDVVVGLGLFAFTAFPQSIEALRVAYPAAVLVFLALLPGWLQRMPAGHGLDPRVGRPMGVGFGLAMAALAVLMGAAFLPLLMKVAWPEGSRPGLIMILVVFGAVCLAVWWIARRTLGATSGARSPAEPRGHRSRSMELGFLASLMVLTAVHESWAWTWIIDSQRNLGPMSVAMLPTAMALLVWPGRALYQLERPFDDGPRWRFLMLIGSFALYALIGS